MKNLIPSDGSSAVVLTDKHGVTRYLNEFGQLHREGDLPAQIDSNGDVRYYKNGSLHRDGNQPAVITSNLEAYYKHGSPHREDGPAIIHTLDFNGVKKLVVQEYYKDGLLHRENGPARLWETGSYQHYKNGQLHNEKGPACHWVEHNKNRDEYYLNGNSLSKFAHRLLTIRNDLSSNNSKKMRM
jgi:antitoxin component YwqK of YwqJK toxin-antitoxin module